MDFLVTEFRGIKVASGTVSPITIIAGKNGQGKSSILQAVAAAMTGLPIPFLHQGSKPGKVTMDLTKKDSEELVRSGSKTGSVSVATDNDNTMTLTWPDCKHVAGMGMNPPKATIHATGLFPWKEMCSTSRSIYLTKLLNATPTETDMKEYLSHLGLSEKMQSWAITSVTKNGWESTESRIKTDITQKKGAWKQITREQWGSKKAQTWTPTGWEDDLAGEKFTDLQAEMNAAKMDVEVAIRDQAVGEDKVIQLRKTAGGAEETNKAEADLKKKDARLAALLTQRDGLDKPIMVDTSNQTACPQCKTTLLVSPSLGSGFDLTKPEEIDTARNKKLLDAYGGIDGSVKAAKIMRDTAHRTLNTLHENNRVATAAQTSLDNMKSGNVTADQLAEARKVLLRAESLLAAFTSHDEAKKTNDAISARDVVLQFLEPGGMRHKKMVDSMEPFNSDLALLSDSAGWGLIQIDPSMNLTMGGRKYFSLSDSEKFRAQATLQVAIARVDQSDMVILDGAEILDQSGKNGLLKMLMKMKIRALIGMMINKPKLVPDLAKVKRGHAYWVDGGTMVSLADVLEVA